MTVRVSNGVKERRKLWTAIRDDQNRTAIAENDRKSHPPVVYDFTGGPTQTEWMLPGAQMTFPVVSSAPESATVKDLILNQGDEKGADLRVSLTNSSILAGPNC